MAAQRRSSKLLLWAVAAALLFQTLVTNVACSRHLASLEDDKAYSSRTPKSPSKDKPSCPTPSHGKGGGYTSPPSDGGGISSPPSGGSGSGSGSGSKSPPSGSGYKSPPGKGSDSPPSGSGSGTLNPPGGSGSGSPSNPIIDPGTGTPYLPGVPLPPSIWLPSPGIPPFITGTCDYWRTHPQAIWAICGYWNTIGRMLGLSPPSTSPNLSLLDALKISRNDGLGNLYREGTAAFLNSLANQKFVFSTTQVRNAFAAALVSDQAAAAQAQIFKSANEGRL